MAEERESSGCTGCIILVLVYFAISSVVSATTAYSRSFSLANAVIGALIGGAAGGLLAGAVGGLAGNSKKKAMRCGPLPFYSLLQPLNKLIEKYLP